jgi:Zn-dependent protease
VATFAFAFAFINLSMFVFNLLPIPGLDGWRVADILLRRRYPKFFFEAWMRRREVWVMLLILNFAAAILPNGTNLLATALFPLYWPVAHLAFGQCLSYPGLPIC